VARWAGVDVRSDLENRCASYWRTESSNLSASVVKPFGPRLRGFLEVLGGEDERSEARWATLGHAEPSPDEPLRLTRAMGRLLLMVETVIACVAIGVLVVLTAPRSKRWVERKLQEKNDAAS